MEEVTVTRLRAHLQEFLATVLLANDPDFTVGTRLEKTMELGFADRKSVV